MVDRDSVHLRVTLTHEQCEIYDQVQNTVQRLDQQLPALIRRLFRSCGRQMSIPQRQDLRKFIEHFLNNVNCRLHNAMYHYLSVRASHFGRKKTKEFLQILKTVDPQNHFWGKLVNPPNGLNERHLRVLAKCKRTLEKDDKLNLQSELLIRIQQCESKSEFTSKKANPQPKLKRNGILLGWVRIPDLGTYIQDLSLTETHQPHTHDQTRAANPSINRSGQHECHLFVTELSKKIKEE